MKDVSCRENLGSFYQITLRQSGAKLEVKLGFPASSLSFLILSAPTAMGQLIIRSASNPSGISWGMRLLNLTAGSSLKVC